MTSYREPCGICGGGNGTETGSSPSPSVFHREVNIIHRRSLLIILHRPYWILATDNGGKKLKETVLSGKSLAAFWTNPMSSVRLNSSCFLHLQGTMQPPLVAFIFIAHCCYVLLPSSSGYNAASSSCLYLQGYPEPLSETYIVLYYMRFQSLCSVD